MRNVIWIVLFLLVLTSHARAAELPEDLTDALPDQAAEWMEEIPEDDFAGGVTGILEQMGNKAGDIVRQRVRGAAGVLVVVVLNRYFRIGISIRNGTPMVCSTS